MSEETSPRRNDTDKGNGPAVSTRRAYKAPTLSRRERLSQVTASAQNPSGVSADGQNPV